MNSRSPLSPDEQGRRSECDALLQAYLQTQDEEESRCLVARLIADHAGPIVKSTIRSKFGLRPGNSATAGRNPEDADDLYGEVVLEVLARLRSLRSNHGPSTITDFRGFVRVLSYDACSRQFRRMNPRRHSFSGKVRYHLNLNPDLAVWLDNRNEWICGLAKWREEARPVWKPGLSQPRDLFELFRDAIRSEDHARIKSVPALADALFDWAAAPLELDDVIEVATKFLAALEPTVMPRDLAHSYTEPDDDIPDLRVDIAGDVERRAYLGLVWAEVKSLPLRQRRALLLNLRDAVGQGAAALIPVTGVATAEELARVLEMSLEDLQSIWNDLPLDDATIAGRLGLSRQQVINLRRAARERLQRRMKAFGASE
jgi:hypothetical protein